MRKIMQFSILFFVVAMVLWGIGTIDFNLERTLAERKAKTLAKEQNEKQKNYCDSIDDIMIRTLGNKVIARNPKPYIYVGEENFEKLVAYIEKNGAVIHTFTSLPACQYALIFCDLDGTEHCMVTIKVDEAGEPSVNGTVHKIYGQVQYGKEWGEIYVDHFFYDIYKDKIVISAPNDSNIERHRLVVKKGYEEILADAQK